jgi:hypothetical protein
LFELSWGASNGSAIHDPPHEARHREIEFGSASGLSLRPKRDYVDSSTKPIDKSQFLAKGQAGLTRFSTLD